MRVDGRDWQHWVPAHNLYCLGPVYDETYAWRCNQYIPPPQVWHVGSQANAAGGGQIALPEHPQEANGEAYLHTRTQGAHEGGQTTQLSKEVQ